jgi:NADP-dependent 3-hydroxy acid dehydrogenase YdfG
VADAAPAVLITGATSGLGRYLARQLASSGWQVLAHGRDPARVANLPRSLAAVRGATSLIWPGSATCGNLRPWSARRCRSSMCW